MGLGSGLAIGGFGGVLFGLGGAVGLLRTTVVVSGLGVGRRVLGK